MLGEPAPDVAGNTRVEIPIAAPHHVSAGRHLMRFPAEIKPVLLAAARCHLAIGAGQLYLGIKADASMRAGAPPSDPRRRCIALLRPGGSSCGQSAFAHGLRRPNRAPRRWIILELAS
jgi:hypothetical protein